MATTDSERRGVCPDCGEAVGHEKVSGKVTAISRVQVLQFSKGLPGPKGDSFETPLVFNVDRGCSRGGPWAQEETLSRGASGYGHR